VSLRDEVSASPRLHRLSRGSTATELGSQSEEAGVVSVESDAGCTGKLVWFVLVESSSLGSSSNGRDPAGC
jgi:hypothetical protein